MIPLGARRENLGFSYPGNILISHLVISQVQMSGQQVRKPELCGFQLSCGDRLPDRFI